VARINLRIAFPEWSEAQRERVLEAALANMARGLVEVAFLRDLRRENLDELFEFEGLERIDRARAASKSGAAIALTGHFGSFELLAPVLSLRGYPVSLVYRPRTDPGIERIIDGWRTRAGVETIPRGQAARATLRALRDGRCVGMPLDQDVGRREGVFVPFFSRLACTRDGPARIAVRAGVEVVPIFLFRIGASARHRVRVYDPVPLVREGDPDAAARENTWRMNKVFEAAIREAPDHWAWTHRRWRTQPPGDPRPYPSRRR
jgi:KDO2-lipid IV(A) lauroyltransferase